MSGSKHTPVPWWVLEGKTLIHVETANPHPVEPGVAICSVPIRDRANADFIVRAANSHEDLLAACEAAYSYLDESGQLAEPLSSILDAAIAKARGAK